MSTYWAILFAFLHFLNSSFASPRWPGSIRRVRANLRQSRSRTTALGQRFFKAWHGLTRQQQVSKMAHLMTYDMSSVISFWLNSTALVWALSKLFPFQTPRPIDQQNAFGYNNSLFWTLALPWISLAQSRTSRRVRPWDLAGDVW